MQSSMRDSGNVGRGERRRVVPAGVSLPGAPGVVEVPALLAAQIVAVMNQAFNAALPGLEAAIVRDVLAELDRRQVAPLEEDAPAGDAATVELEEEAPAGGDVAAP